MGERISRHWGKGTLAILFGSLVVGLALRLASSGDDFDIWADY